MSATEYHCPCPEHTFPNGNAGGGRRLPTLGELGLRSEYRTEWFTATYTMQH